ncbi:hypothetical protein [Shewanella aestuarii]|uniref:Uncharacterized protein n=1 Tax=Shewanella aestuarii TaxID=1028752 RepID=A0A6G9QPU6_9GAMM|nr:hypothetical protein [Shewanella aestuarii]QIR16586.1 hypothetical protein HBH39_19110 [Shewanella aestuarii]
MSTQHRQGNITQSQQQALNLIEFIRTLKQLSKEQAQSVNSGLLRLRDPAIDNDFSLLTNVYCYGTGKTVEDIEPIN